MLFLLLLLLPLLQVIDMLIFKGREELEVRSIAAWHASSEQLAMAQYSAACYGRTVSSLA
jgi:hypothetical protein